MQDYLLQYQNQDGSTNWDKLESEECHQLFQFERNGIEASIQLQRGQFSMIAKRLENGNTKVDSITRDRAQQIARVARSDKSFAIKFDGGLL